jgi:hypothetical protein
MVVEIKSTSGWFETLALVSIRFKKALFEMYYIYTLCMRWDLMQKELQPYIFLSVVSSWRGFVVVCVVGKATHKFGGPGGPQGNPHIVQNLTCNFFCHKKLERLSIRCRRDRNVNIMSKILGKVQTI